MRDPADQRSIDARVSLALWLPIAFLTALAMLAFQACGFRLIGTLVSPVLGTLFLGVATTRFLADRPGLRPLGLMMGTLFQGATLASAALMLTYAAACANRPLADSLMLRIDHAFGYDWRAYVGWFAAHPAFGRLSVLCYNSNILQPALLIILLVLYGHGARLNRFVLVNIVTLAVATAIFSLLPVTTAWVHDSLSASQIAQFHFISGSNEGWIRELLRIRSGELRLLPPDFGEGLVGFPSFHAVSALLNIWAAWPLRRVRWVILPINLMMLASTPVIGGHYFADVLGGAILTFASVTLVNRLYPGLAKRAATPTEPVRIAIPA